MNKHEAAKLNHFAPILCVAPGLNNGRPWDYDTLRGDLEECVDAGVTCSISTTGAYPAVRKTRLSPSRTSWIF